MKQNAPKVVLLMHLLLAGMWLLPFSATAKAAVNPTVVVKSPNRQLYIKIYVNEARQWVYEVAKQQQTIIAPSHLGLLLDSIDFSKDIAITSYSKPSFINESYPIFGNHAMAHNRANEVVLTVNKNGVALQLYVRVYNDGVAFRYGLPNTAQYLQKELTTWNIDTTKITIAWSEFSHCYEGVSKVTAMAQLKPMQLLMPPVTCLVNNYYVSISEADCETFSDMAMHYTTNGLQAIFPFAKKGWAIVKNTQPNSNLNGLYRGQQVSPWRSIIIASDVNTLVNSDLISNLCKAPAKDSDFSWVKPGRCLWQWWSDGAPKQAEQQQWFDAAAKLKWEYYLIDEGWRDWRQAGKDQWQLLAEAVAYGKSVGVKSIVWVDSKEMPTATKRREYLKRVKALGADGIKIDFIPDATAERMQWYMESIQDCANLQLMVNFHGSVKPTGINRTYPNDITREAVRGNEFHMIRYQRIQPLSHDVSLPFTRLLTGPADVTPVMLNPTELATAKFTWAHELAQAIVYLSPLTHFADHYQYYLQSPMFDLLQQLPTFWDETRVLPSTKMGQVVVFARRKGSTWWIGALNGEKEQTVTIPVDFLSKTAKATLIFDSEKGFAAINRIEETIKAPKNITVKMAAGGGFVAKMEQ